MQIVAHLFLGKVIQLLVLVCKSSPIFLIFDLLLDAAVETFAHFSGPALPRVFYQRVDIVNGVEDLGSILAVDVVLHFQCLPGHV